MLIAFALLGLGLAPIVPIVFSAAGNVGGGAQALGWVVTMSYVGVVLGPAAIGAVAHGVGLRWGLVIPAALALVAAALAGFARDRRRRRSRPRPSRRFRRRYSAKTGYDMRVVTTASASRPYSRALSIATAAWLRAPSPASGRARRTSPRAC